MNVRIKLFNKPVNIQPYNMACKYNRRLGKLVEFFNVVRQLRYKLLH